MAIHVESFTNNILTIREFGHIDAEDAQAFERTLYAYASKSPVPIVVLIDAREVDIIMPGANRYFTRSSTIANIKVHIVVTQGLVITQAAHILAMRNYHKNTVVLESWEEAVAFAQAQVTAKT